MKLLVFQTCLVLGLIIYTSGRPLTMDEMISNASGGTNRFNLDKKIVELDILLPEDNGYRKAINDTKYRWRKGIVPYEIDSSFTSAEVKRIKGSMTYWRKKTGGCVRFRAATSGDANRILVTNADPGCFSGVGRWFSQPTQPLNLAAGCIVKKVIIHELGHTLGLYHEQSRPNRDRKVTIKWENIEEGKEHNFQIRTNIKSYRIKYDYKSIMHYGQNFFSKNGLPTIITTNPDFQDVIGTNTRASLRDIKLMKAMYC